MVFVNGLPLAVIELKNTGRRKATVSNAYNQLQTYQLQIPRLFHFNEVLVISDGTTPRSAPRRREERFAAWKTIDGETSPPAATLEVAIKGVFERRRFLDLVRSFIVFEDDGRKLAKKIARYHQFHAVRKALEPPPRVVGRWRRQGRRPLAHAGLRQVADDALLRRKADPPSGHGTIRPSSC